MTTITAANLVFPVEHWLAMGPILVVALGAVLSLLLATLPLKSWGEHRRLPLLFFTFAVLCTSAWWQIAHWPPESLLLFNGMMRIDYFSSFFNLLVLGSTILVLLGSYSYLTSEGIHYSEFYALLLFSTLGMMLLGSSQELLTIFTALELMSLAVYVLVGMRRRDRLSNEAAVKYFVMGGVGAAITLYGVAFLYGATATTNLAKMGEMISHNQEILHNSVFVFGFVLLLVGFLFKIAAVPFHMWAPDVYEGAPTLVTSYMSTALKVAVFAALIRITYFILGSMGPGELSGIVHTVLWTIALVTIALGNLMALVQKNLKRLLAYSAIAHTGYLLVGILAGPAVGYAGILTYLVAYAAMNIGAFGCLALIGGRGDVGLNLDDFKGLGYQRPWLAAAMSLFLLSLGGFPPTAGFAGKYFLFTGALEAGETVLVLLAVLFSVISIYYYLRVVVFMYMYDAPARPVAIRPTHIFAAVAIVACIYVTLHVGIYPQHLLMSANKAVAFSH